MNDVAIDTDSSAFPFASAITSASPARDSSTLRFRFALLCDSLAEKT